MKGKRIIIWLMLALVLVGCRPQGVLSSRQMRDVLHDLHRADAIMQIAGLNYGHEDEVGKYYQVVLDKHGVTQAQFDSSMVWYTDHPQIFDKIYPKVVARLEQEQEEWIAINDAEEAEKRNRKERMRELLPMDELLQLYRDGLVPYWPNPEEEAKKMQENAEKFVYIEIFS